MATRRFDPLTFSQSAIVGPPAENHPRQTTGGSAYDGMQLVIRPQRRFAAGERSGHFDTFFGHYIDRVLDPSRAKQKDPDIQNRMRQDLQIVGSMNVRKLATSQLRRQWVPSPMDFGGVVAKRFEGWFDGQYRVTESLMNMMDAILDGISIQEILWSRPSRENGYSFGIERMFNAYKDRFVFTKDGKLCLKTRSSLFYGEQVHPWQFITHQYGSTGGSWSQPGDEARLYWGRGLEDNIYPTYFFKTCTLNLYTRWLQRLSGGVFVGRYPHKETGAQDRIMAIMSAWQEDEAFAIPAGEDWSYEIHEGSKVAPDTFLMFIDYCDKNMAKAILGATLVNDQTDVGSHALGEAQMRNTFQQICAFDRTGIEETINKAVVTPLGELNCIPRDLWPKMKFCLDPDQRGGPLLDDLQKLQQMGFNVTAELVSETTGYRMPAPGETVLQAKADPMTGGFGGLDRMNQVNGEGSPLSRVDINSPQGMQRFQEAVAKVGMDRAEEYLAYTHPGKVYGYAEAAEGHWITIGAEKGEDGKKHGGTPVLIGSDGTIHKGPKQFVGQKIGELGQKKTDDKEQLRNEQRKQFAGKKSSGHLGFGSRSDAGPESRWEYYKKGSSIHRAPEDSPIAEDGTRIGRPFASESQWENLKPKLDIQDEHVPFSNSQGRPGLFGGIVYPDLKHKQGEFFDTSKPAPIKESAEDARIRAKFDPKHTAKMDFTPAPKVETPTPEAAPEPEKPAAKGKRPRAWSRASISRQIAAAMASEGANEQFDELHQRVSSEFPNARTFHKKLPGEVKRLMQGRPALRKFFRVTDDPKMAGGEDAMSDLGEDTYSDWAEGMAGDRSKFAISVARKSGNPEIKFLLDVYDNLDASAPIESHTPAELSPGDSFELGGKEIEVGEDRVMRDGDDFSPVPVDWLKQVPTDPGTLRKAEVPF